MQPFDILFYKGTNPVSKLVQAFTNSEFSHVALILDDKHLVEINWSYKLKIRHIKYPECHFQIYRLNEHIYEDQATRMYDYMYENLDSKYDFKEILGMVLYRFFKIKPENDVRKFICSSWINECFKSVGIVLSEKDLVSPQDLISEKLHLVQYRDIISGNIVRINNQNRTL